MVKSLKRPLDQESGLRQLLKHILESGKVSGVFTLTRVEEGRVAYALITDPRKVDKAVPLHPLMPVNLGQILNRFTLKGMVSQPIAVVARPCELRALVEDVKRRQGRLDNIFFISYTCGGVFPLDFNTKPDQEESLLEYWRSVRQNLINQELRPACRSCVEFVPYTADLTIRVVDGKNEFVALANNVRGESLINDVTEGIGEDELDEAAIAELRKRRAEERVIVFESYADVSGLDGLVNVFGRCINCHACGKACPICYCTLCTFESSAFERKPEDIEGELLDKKGVRLPLGTIYFHLGRMIHMAASCVACGSCQDVCPVDIPVAVIFKKVGESLQKKFEYIPGRDLKEAVPLSTFDAEEFMDIENEVR